MSVIVEGQCLDLYNTSFSELKAGLIHRQFTCHDLVSAYLDRIKEASDLKSVVCVNPNALDEATVADELYAQGRATRPLEGLPILLKDNVNTVDMPTTVGSWSLKDAMAKEDATVVKQLKEAGAIILGKAALSEFAFFRSSGDLPSGWSGISGQVTSAWYKDANPSGSSSGSGVAMSIGLAAGTLGTETSGSIIGPSDGNGIVGLRPTVGLVSRAGIAPISSNHDSAGPMTACVKDAALVLDCIAGVDPLDPITREQPKEKPDYVSGLRQDALQGVRLGVALDHIVWSDDIDLDLKPGYSRFPFAIKKIFEDALHVLRQLGATIVLVKYKYSMEDIFCVHTNPETGKQESNGPLRYCFSSDMHHDFPKWLDTLQSNPNNLSSVQDVVDFNNSHPELEKPPGYEDQSRLVEAARSMPSREEDEQYQSHFRHYTNLARTCINSALMDHDVSALIWPGEFSQLGSCARYPQLSVPCGFYPKDTILKPVKSKTSGEEFPHTTFTQYPGRPIGLTFAGTAYSEAQLLAYGYAYEQATQVRSKSKDGIVPSLLPKTQLPACIVSHK